MYLDETTTKLLVLLAVALIMIIFAELAFLYETNKECKELRRENRKLLQGKERNSSRSRRGNYRSKSSPT